MKSKFMLAILLVLLVCSLCYSQDDWEKTPFDKWDKNQLKKILTDSPWAKTKELKFNLMGIVDLDQRAVVLLRSALPIRLALLRQVQIEKNYDSLSKSGQAEFDKKYSTLYICPACREYYVFSIISKDSSLSKTTIDKYKNKIFLENDKGERRELINFMSQIKNDKNELLFFFKRIDKDGKLFLSAENKFFTFNLDFKSADIRDFPIKKVEYSVADITRDNMVVF